MKLELRAPRDAEWKICRMLLPETFASVQSREYLLALREETPRLIGAVSFRRVGDQLKDLRVHIVPRSRRMGAATEILHAIKASGVRSISAYANAGRENDAVRFCEHAGLRRSDGLTTVETDLKRAQAYLNPLRERSSSPAELRIVPLAEAPLAEVARLQSRYIARETDLNPWRARLAEMPELNDSLVATLNGQVVGMLLWEQAGEKAIIRSRVAEANAASKWVNLLLLAEVVDLMLARGLRRVQFSFADDNRDTRRVTARFGAETTDEVAEYTWTKSEQ